jgi:hypothetical protein
LYESLSPIESRVPILFYSGFDISFSNLQRRM